MSAYKTRERRLFELKRSDWAMLLVGVVLCGFATLILL